MLALSKLLSEGPYCQICLATSSWGHGGAGGGTMNDVVAVPAFVASPAAVASVCPALPVRVLPVR